MYILFFCNLKKFDCLRWIFIVYWFLIIYGIDYIYLNINKYNIKKGFNKLFGKIRWCFLI